MARSETVGLEERPLSEPADEKVFDLGSPTAPVFTLDNCMHESAVRHRCPTPEETTLQAVIQDAGAAIHAAKAKKHSLRRQEDNADVSADQITTNEATTGCHKANGTTSIAEQQSNMAEQIDDPGKTAWQFISRMTGPSRGKRVAQAVVLCSEAVANDGGHSNDCLATDQGRKSATALLRQLRLTGLPSGPSAPAQGFVDTGTYVNVCQERVARRVYPNFKPDENGEAIAVVGGAQVKSTGKITVHLEILDKQPPNWYPNTEVYVVQSIPGNLDMLLGRGLALGENLVTASSKETPKLPEESNAESGV